MMIENGWNFVTELFKSSEKPASSATQITTSKSLSKSSRFQNEIITTNNAPIQVAKQTTEFVKDLEYYQIQVFNLFELYLSEWKQTISLYQIYCEFGKRIY